ncbi:SDR family NAD(P)-dependent oxidoreductase [Streptomyces griseofuscus]|uniref:SDR family NAD(P)-dependent oxidoreductase n=1 Tax=Streptomyces griseofuscus TaxID=146922 RepID=UPI001431E6BA
MVTGSAQGIGLAIATGLARAGARVVVNGRGEERVADAVRTVRAGSGSEDVTGAAGDLATERGAADVLRAVPALDDAEWRRHFEVNVLSAVRLVRAYLPGMKERGWGRILDLASDSAVAVPAEMTTGVIHWQLVAVRENQVADDCGST